MKTLQKQYKEIHITTTDKEIVIGEKRNDWNYEMKAERINGVRIGKLYRSRGAASRVARILAKRVIHWYPF